MENTLNPGYYVAERIPVTDIFISYEKGEYDGGFYGDCKVTEDVKKYYPVARSDAKGLKEGMHFNHGTVAVYKSNSNSLIHFMRLTDLHD